MVRLLKKLVGFSVQSEGGEIGGVEDFLIDPFEWRVRYLVVNTADWLDGRFVLLSSTAAGAPDEPARIIPVSVSREMVRSSPEVGPGKILTRSLESELHNYFKWPYYWKLWDEGGLGPGNLTAIPLVELASDVEKQQREAGGEEESGEGGMRLFSLKELSGFSLQARDGRAGALSGLVVNDEDWNVLYLAAEPEGLDSAGQVLLSPHWVQAVSRLESSLSLDLDRETVRNSPAFNPDLPLDQDLKPQHRR